MPSVILPIGSASDGTQSRWPAVNASKGIHASQAEVKTYKTAIGQKWMKARGQEQSGVTYEIENLPAGYKLYSKARANSRADKELYGHPSGYGFRSSAEFFVHFATLMRQGNSAGCLCKGCARASNANSTHVAVAPLTNASNIMSASQSQVPSTDVATSTSSAPSNNMASSASQVPSTIMATSKPSAQSNKVMTSASSASSNNMAPPSASSASPHDIASSASAMSSNNIMPSPYPMPSNNMMPSLYPMPSNSMMPSPYPELSNDMASSAYPAPPSPNFTPSLSNDLPPLPARLQQMADDGESTDDVYAHYLEMVGLEPAEPVHKTLEQPNSIDWCIEHGPLINHIRDMLDRADWLPRKGEIVLFTRDLMPSWYLSIDPKDNYLKIWDAATNSMMGFPTLEAGVITICPTDKLSLEDLLVEKFKYSQLHYPRFRIEPMSEIGNTYKPWSRRRALVGLHQIRPFNFWRELTHGVELHPTVSSAITAVPTLSQLARTCLRSTPNMDAPTPYATIFLMGLYIGAELVLIGDYARIRRGDGSTHIREIMQIESIQMRVSDMDAVANCRKNFDPRLTACQSATHVEGNVYTNEPSNARDPGIISIPGYDAYGPWYRTHHRSETRVFPFHRIIGRCYPDEVSMMWFPQYWTGQGPKRQTDLSLGAKGVMWARSLKNDPRVSYESGKTWFMGETRVEQLDLHEVNDVAVGARAQFGAADGSVSPRQAKHLEVARRARQFRHKWIDPNGPFYYQTDAPGTVRSGNTGQIISESYQGPGGVPPAANQQASGAEMPIMIKDDDEDMEEEEMEEEEMEEEEMEEEEMEEEECEEEEKEGDDEDEEEEGEEVELVVEDRMETSV